MPVTPSAPKKLKNNFFQDKFYSLKAHAHYFTVLISLATWRAAKHNIFNHFMSINLPWCRQSINSLIRVSHSGGTGARGVLPPILQFFSKIPPPKLMPLPRGTPSLKNEPHLIWKTTPHPIETWNTPPWNDS